MMLSRIDWRLASATFAVLTLASAGARAQDDLVEEPAVEEPAPVEEQYTTPPRTAAPPAQPAVEDVPPPVDAAPPTDHSLVVGRMGVGYLGLSNVPVCDPGGFDCSTGQIAAPILGVRYWASERLGIEVGVGAGLTLGKNKVDDGVTETTIDDPTVGAVALHGGLPLALVHSRHFTFLFSPEAQFGFAKGSTNDISVSGVVLRAGFRLGAEIQFGFIGIPQLSLTAGIGLHANYVFRGASDSVLDASIRDNAFAFGTSVQGNPWAIFTNGISALYYF